MKVLVFGKSGQVGSSLADTMPADIDVDFVDRSCCDLSDDRSIQAALEKHAPDFIVNAAAYTQVDEAESEPEIAFQVNAGAPQKMAMWSRDNGAKFLHLSTDFVFSGHKRSPYKPMDVPHPLNVYGQSKLLGENVAHGFSNGNAMIVRTSWVYSEYGSNFVKTILRLMSERDELSVVNDQRGSPTYARSLAEIIWRMICEDQFVPGIFHWTDSGDITWYDFAVAIQEQALELGMLDNRIEIKAISTADYPTPAERPVFSVLDMSELAHRLGTEPFPWRNQLHIMMQRLSAFSEKDSENDRAKPTSA